MFSAIALVSTYTYLCKGPNNVLFLLSKKNSPLPKKQTPACFKSAKKKELMYIIENFIVFLSF